MKVLVLYYSKTGHTLEAVTPMAEGLKSSGADVTVVSTAEFKNSMIEDCDAFIVGSPCWAGTVGVTGAATPVIKVLKNLPKDSLKGKKCAGIAVHAAAGGKNTLAHIKRLLNDKECNNYKEGPVGKAGTLASITKGKALSASDKDRFKAFGTEFVS